MSSLSDARVHIQREWDHDASTLSWYIGGGVGIFCLSIIGVLMHCLPDGKRQPMLEAGAGFNFVPPIERRHRFKRHVSLSVFMACMVLSVVIVGIATRSLHDKSGRMALGHALGYAPAQGS